MHRIQKNRRQYNPRSRQQIRSLSSIRKKIHPNNRQEYKNNNKLFQIINEFEDILQQLKIIYKQNIDKQNKYYHNIINNKNNKITLQIDQYLNNQHQDKIIQQQTTTLCIPEIQELKKSFINIYGYNSNNIVQLYHFYKNNYYKNYKFFSSTSISNMINLTQNQSDIRDKGGKINNTACNQKLSKQNQNYHIKDCQESQDGKQLLINTQNISRKSNEMVNVGSLLAQKRRISKKNICQNINSQNLLKQTKKKLCKPPPLDYLSKLQKIKENLKHESVKNVSNKKIKEFKQMSSSKKDAKKKMIKEITHQPSKIADFVIQSKNDGMEKLIIPQKIMEKSIQLSRIQQFKGQISAFELQTDSKPKNPQMPKNPKEASSNKKEPISIKSPKQPSQFRSVKHQSQKKQVQLNKGILLDLSNKELKQIQNTKYINNNNNKMYFIPRVHANHFDSLLDCQITMEELSKIVDLESIPFDF